MSAYQSMLAVLADVADEPEASAIEILEALRVMPNEVVQAGVNPVQWYKACKAMIAASKVADNARRAGMADVRRAAWPEMKRQLEQAGCKITNPDEEIKQVVGAGVSIDINLITGGVRHSHGDLGDQLPEFDRIVDYIIRSVAGRNANDADLARRKERNKTHRWDNKKKVWLPRNGVGPIIPQGK